MLRGGSGRPQCGQHPALVFISVRDEKRLKALQEPVGRTAGDGYSRVGEGIELEVGPRRAAVLDDGRSHRPLTHLSHAPSMGRAVSVLIGGFEEKAITEAVGAEEGVRL